ncbi:MAG: thermosome subunit [Methanosarcinales archaeon]|nr:thermosome subunit [Methanosarcinales archaeon]
MAGLSGYPVIVVKEGQKREAGKDAQHKNIMAARAVADAVRTTLGPKGMDKMLVSNTGDVTVTNDGATILWELEIEHPVAKMIVEVARAQDDEVGDGTTTAVIIAGELLKKAEALLDRGIHPTIIVQGYRQAAVRAKEVLENMAMDISSEDREMLAKIAQTAMTGKGIEVLKDELSRICVDAAIAVQEQGKVDVERRIKMVKIVGGSLKDTTFNQGVVLEKERLNPSMPRKVKGAQIALFDGTLELKKLGTDAKISIKDVEGLQGFRQGEEKVLEEQVEAIASSGANVLFCTKGIGNTASHFLAKSGILATRRIKDEDMKRLSLATGGKVVGDIMQITAQDLGQAELVEERKVGEEHMIFVEGCLNPKAVSIIFHGGSEVFLGEIERAFEDALYVVSSVLEFGTIVPGGGAPEVEVAEAIRNYSSTLSGREQLAVSAFAEAMESIPRILADNAGLDAINVLVGLRTAHGGGQRSAGVDVMTGEPTDMLAKGVVEPLQVKVQAIKSATEAATMVLRVDHVIAAKKEPLTPKPGQSPHDYTRPGF